ncbi:recombination directionality factor [Microbacterium sp. B24]|uniref:recombination directionality factor n=1 Tax=Microbacterium sp. B24 TaxID=95616 RepID=UPI00041A0626|nr:hypothetical protein [Microbacterium sp. B24]
MALKVFGTDPATQPKLRQSFADDVVGRFRAGHSVNGRPASLEEWRVTTGDPEVAAKVHELLGGDAPQKFETKGEDDIEVFTASAEVDIVIVKPIRQRMVFWSRANKLVYATDGEWKLDDSGNPTDEPDPDASLSFAERKQKGQDGLGPVPDTELYFRLAADPDLGIFKFQTGSWGLVRDLAYDGTEDILADALADGDGKASAVLKLVPTSFVAKNGPRAGQTVSFTKSAITDIKAAA